MTTWERASKVLMMLPEKLTKIGAKVIHLAFVFGIYSIRSSGLLIVSEVAVPKRLFQAILERIRHLQPPKAVPG